MLNKLDLLPEEEREQRCQEVIDGLDWQGPGFNIAAINRQGTDEVSRHVTEYIESVRDAEKQDPELLQQEKEFQLQMQQDARERIQALRDKQRAERLKAKGKSLDDDDDFDDDDYDVDVVYVE